MNRMWRVFFIGICMGAYINLYGASETNSGTSSQQVSDTVSPLGQKKSAWAAAGISVTAFSSIGSWVAYKTLEQFFNQVLEYVPLLRSYHDKAAQIGAGAVTLPLSVVALMKGAPLATYFFYILYTGERLSPLLARNALHDIKVYVQHLNTIKSVQKDLYDVIEQINQLSIEKKVVKIALDLSLLEQLQETIKQDDKYIQNILAQLQIVLSKEEVAQFIEELTVQGYFKDYCVAPELQNQTQAIISQLQTAVNSLDDDAPILNALLTDLIRYWHDYTVTLADGISADVQFCNQVHIIEQIISKWLDRSLLCI